MAANEPCETGFSSPGNTFLRSISTCNALLLGLQPYPPRDGSAILLSGHNGLSFSRQLPGHSPVADVDFLGEMHRIRHLTRDIGCSIASAVLVKASRRNRHVLDKCVIMHIARWISI